MLLLWLLKTNCLCFLSMSLFIYFVYCWYFWSLVHVFVVFKAQCTSEYSAVLGLWRLHGLYGPHGIRGSFPQRSMQSVLFQMLSTWLELLRCCYCLLLEVRCCKSLLYKSIALYYRFCQIHFIGLLSKHCCLCTKMECSLGEVSQNS